MTSERPPQTSQAWDEESGGASWHLESSTDGDVAIATTAEI